MVNGTFGALFGNSVGSAGSFVFSVGSKVYQSAGIDFSVGPGEVRWIRGLLKTPVLYVDSSTVKLVYQVRDEAGRSQVNTMGLVVELTLNVSDTLIVSLSSCGPPDSLSGVGMCSYSLDIGLFSTTSSRVGYVILSALSSSSSSPMAQSESLSVELRRVSTFQSP
eukprot:gene26351-33118_t